jgi:hypothetical protein
MLLQNTYSRKCFRQTLSLNFSNNLYILFLMRFCILEVDQKSINLELATRVFAEFYLTTRALGCMSAYIDRAFQYEYGLHTYRPYLNKRYFFVVFFWVLSDVTKTAVKPFSVSWLTRMAAFSLG